MKRNRMEHEGYTGTVEWYDNENIFKGQVLGIKSNIEYSGKNINELRKDFYKKIDDYIQTCEKNNLKKEVPYKGSFNVRTTPELYRLAQERCNKDTISMSKLVEIALKEYLKVY